MITFASYQYNLSVFEFELNISKYIRSILRYTRNFNIDKKNVCRSCGLSLPTNLDLLEHAFISIIIFVIFFMNTVLKIVNYEGFLINVQQAFKYLNTKYPDLQFTDDFTGQIFIIFVYKEFCVRIRTTCFYHKTLLNYQFYFIQRESY